MFTYIDLLSGLYLQLTLGCLIPSQLILGCLVPSQLILLGCLVLSQRAFGVSSSQLGRGACLFLSQIALDVLRRQLTGRFWSISCGDS